MVEILIAIVSLVVSIISIAFKHISKKRLEETQKNLDKEIKARLRESWVEASSFKDITQLVKAMETFEHRVDLKDLKEIEITYTKYIRATKVLQSIGRASRLKEKKPVYQKLWVYLNSGLVNSALKNVMYNDDSSEIDKNSIIGMLVGEKIRKDMKSYIFIGISLVVSMSLPVFTSYEVNYWLISFILIFFTLLVLNQKVLEYRISNGFYGSNQYEAREIIGYIERHSSDDDFNGFDNKKVFPRKQHKEQEYKGILEGLLT
ncbi:hypothetical protein VCSRO175_3424 [Vibrio cholerae]|nr:hypothetical protein VCSRO175_3424 [Vibrio cholerae]